jgi:hypothetical protein
LSYLGKRRRAKIKGYAVGHTKRLIIKQNSKPKEHFLR